MNTHFDLPISLESTTLSLLEPESSKKKASLMYGIEHEYEDESAESEPDAR